MEVLAFQMIIPEMIVIHYLRMLKTLSDTNQKPFVKLK